MSERFDSAEHIARAIDQHRARALLRLDGMATNAVGRTFDSCSSSEHSAFVADLASTIARDLTALGLLAHTSAHGAVPGGVWLAPAPDRPGVIVSWTQHEASAAVLGPSLHLRLQRQMNLALFEILLALHYPAEEYGGGGAHIVIGFRPDGAGPTGWSPRGIGG